MQLNNPLEAAESVSLYEAIRSCRAVRRLRPDPIPEAVLARVLQAAVCGPSGGNEQPWRVVVVRASAAKDRLAELYRANWQSYGDEAAARMQRLPEAKRARGLRILEASAHLAEHLAEAPVILLFFHNVQLMVDPGEFDTYPRALIGASLYPAIQNLLLACRAEGLGGVLTTMLWRQSAAIAALVDAPEPWTFHALVPIGYPLGKGHGPLNRKPLASMAFSETWGNGHA